MRPHAFKADNMSKSSDDLDQKSVVKDNMEMKMDIFLIPQDDSAQKHFCEIQHADKGLFP